MNSAGQCVHAKSKRSHRRHRSIPLQGLVVVTFLCTCDSLLRKAIGIAQPHQLVHGVGQ